MRERVALILACAAAFVIVALLAHDFVYPTDPNTLEPSARAELEVLIINTKREILILLIGGLIAWIAGQNRD